MISVTESVCSGLINSISMLFPVLIISHIYFQGETCLLLVYLPTHLLGVFLAYFLILAYKKNGERFFGSGTVLSNYAGFLKIFEYFRLQCIRYCKQQLRFHPEVMEETGI